MRRKLAYFIGCYNKFNDPVTAQDTIFVLNNNDIDIKLLDLGCCGIPFIGIGDLGSAKKRAVAISRELKKLILEGFDVVLSCVSCGAMIKIEYPALFDLMKENELKSRIYNIGDYLLRLYKTGQFNINLKEVNTKVGYHVPCHLKIQKIGSPFVNLLELVPKLEIKAVFSKCCGMAGTMGFKKEKFDLSQTIGNSLIEEISNSGLHLILSDCASCQIKITHEAKARTLHPISILKEAIT